MVAIGSIDTCVIVYEVDTSALGRITVSNVHLGGVNAVAFVDECTIASSGEDASVCINLSHPIQTYQNHFLIPVIIVEKCSFYSRFNSGLFVRFSFQIYPRFQEPNRTEKSKLNQIIIYIYLSAFYFPILKYPNGIFISKISEPKPNIYKYLYK